MLNIKENNSVAYIDKITSIIPIQDADKIELATIEGWTSIIAKDNYKVGDKVAVFIDDAVIPEDLANFLDIKKYLRKGNRVHTIKLKGVYSEVVIISLNKLEEFLTEKNTVSNPNSAYTTDLESYRIKESLEALLEIKKYEPPEDLSTSVENTDKHFLNKSNKYFDKYYKFPLLKNDPKRFTGKDCVEVTRKIHGTNARYGICKKDHLTKWIKFKKLLHISSIRDEYEFVYGSHNVQLGTGISYKFRNNVWANIIRKYDIENKLFKYVKEVLKNKDNLLKFKSIDKFIIYGEIYGKDIQGSYNYGLNEQKIAFFDIQINNDYIPLSITRSVITKMGLDLVPLLYLGKYNKPKIDAFVYNNFIPNTTIPEEGVVIKAADGNRLKTAKIKNPDFLIYAEKHNIPDDH